jgi:hypothetical protein
VRGRPAKSGASCGVHVLASGTGRVTQPPGSTQTVPGAEQSVRAAREYVQQNLPDLAVSPEVLKGEALISFAGPLPPHPIVS